MGGLQQKQDGCASRRPILATKWMQFVRGKIALGALEGGGLWDIINCDVAIDCDGRDALSHSSNDPMHKAHRSTDTQIPKIAKQGYFKASRESSKIDRTGQKRLIEKS